VAASGGTVSAVLWDLDGTIVDTHHLIHRCLDETLREQCGLSYSFEQWSKSAGRPLHLLLEEGLTAHDRNGVSIELLVKDYRHRLKNYEPEVALFPGIRAAVARIGTLGYRQGIVTTKHAEAAARHLTTTELAGHFEVVVTGDQCSAYKPDPDPFLRALERLALPAHQCVVIGDSPADIVGARAAGLRSVAGLWGTLNEDELRAAGPDAVAHTPDDLPATLERLAGL
jgi:pyrophosphatase PpaX